MTESPNKKLQTSSSNSFDSNEAVQNLQLEDSHNLIPVLIVDEIIDEILQQVSTEKHDDTNCGKEVTADPFTDINSINVFMEDWNEKSDNRSSDKPEPPTEDTSEKCCQGDETTEEDRQ